MAQVFDSPLSFHKDIISTSRVKFTPKWPNNGLQSFLAVIEDMGEQFVSDVQWRFVQAQSALNLNDNGSSLSLRSVGILAVIMGTNIHLYCKNGSANIGVILGKSDETTYHNVDASSHGVQSIPALTLYCDITPYDPDTINTLGDINVSNFATALIPTFLTQLFVSQNWESYNLPVNYISQVTSLQIVVKENELEFDDDLQMDVPKRFGRSFIDEIGRGYSFENLTIGERVCLRPRLYRNDDFIMKNSKFSLTKRVFGIVSKLGDVFDRAINQDELDSEDDVRYSRMNFIATKANNNQLVKVLKQSSWTVGYPAGALHLFISYFRQLLVTALKHIHSDERYFNDLNRVNTNYVAYMEYLVNKNSEAVQVRDVIPDKRVTIWPMTDAIDQDLMNVQRFKNWISTEGMTSNLGYGQRIFGCQQVIMNRFGFEFTRYPEFGSVQIVNHPFVTIHYEKVMSNFINYYGEDHSHFTTIAAIVPQLIENNMMVTQRNHEFISISVRHVNGFIELLVVMNWACLLPINLKPWWIFRIEDDYSLEIVSQNDDMFEMFNFLANSNMWIEEFLMSILVKNSDLTVFWAIMDVINVLDTKSLSLTSVVTPFVICADLHKIKNFYLLGYPDIMNMFWPSGAIAYETSSSSKLTHLLEDISNSSSEYAADIVKTFIEEDEVAKRTRGSRHRTSFNFNRGDTIIRWADIIGKLDTSYIRFGGLQCHRIGYALANKIGVALAHEFDCGDGNGLVTPIELCDNADCGRSHRVFSIYLPCGEVISTSNVNTCLDFSNHSSKTTHSCVRTLMNQTIMSCLEVESNTLPM